MRCRCMRCRLRCATGAGAGVRPQRAELSFRLKRADIEQLHRPGAEGYYDALEAVVALCGVLHASGWDLSETVQVA